jgi:hypothetical protein
LFKGGWIREILYFYLGGYIFHAWRITEEKEGKGVLPKRFWIWYEWMDKSVRILSLGWVCKKFGNWIWALPGMGYIEDIIIYDTGNENGNERYLHKLNQPPPCFGERVSWKR